MKPIFLIVIGISFFSSSCQEKELIITPVDPINHSYQFSSEIEEKWKDSDKPWRFQAAGSEYSYIGNYEKVAENFYKDVPDRERMGDSSYAAFTQVYKPVAAFGYILERAKKEQVVIINEAHHKPKHRVLTKELLQGLSDLGFRYFGAETFNKLDIDSLNFRKYPTYKSGTYSIEPEFGSLIRKALEIGYKVFVYESEGNGKPREIGQAKNIQAFLNENKEGKALIHCGYQHAMEGEIEGSWEKAMAGRLLEYTGINPLTVNQTRYDNKFEFKHLSPLQKRINIKEPTVFIDENNSSFEGEENDRGFDILVFHEQNVYENNRSNWLLNNSRKWLKVDLSPIKLNRPYFLFAFKNGEDFKKAIPVDLIEVADSMKEVHFSLVEGKYQVVAQNKSKEAIAFEIEVE